jgi:hypothetical protein
LGFPISSSQVFRVADLQLTLQPAAMSTEHMKNPLINTELMIITQWLKGKQLSCLAPGRSEKMLDIQCILYTIRRSLINGVSLCAENK